MAHELTSDILQPFKKIFSVSNSDLQNLEWFSILNKPISYILMDIDQVRLII